MKNIIIALIVVTTLSCVKEVDLTIRKESNRPVLNCIFNPDSVFRVYLTESNSHELLYPATVKLLKTDSILETLEYFTDNFFEGTTKPELSGRYTVEIHTDKYGAVTSTDRLPNKAVKIESIVQTDSSGFTIQNNLPYANIDIVFKDEPNVLNYYELSIVRIIDTADIVIDVTDDPFFYYYYESIDDFKKELQYMQLMLHSQDKSIVSEGLDRQVDSSVGYNTLFFSDKLFDGEEKTLSVQYIPYYHMNSYYKVKNRKFVVQLRSISENYYMYRKSEAIYRKYKRQESLWKDADSYGHIFSNVENGYGLFAGYIASYDSIIVSND